MPLKIRRPFCRHRDPRRRTRTRAALSGGRNLQLARFLNAEDVGRILADHADGPLAARVFRIRPIVFGRGFAFANLAIADIERQDAEFHRAGSGG